MKRSELKQIIRTVIEESLYDVSAVPDSSGKYQKVKIVELGGGLKKARPQVGDVWKHSPKTGMSFSARVKVIDIITDKNGIEKVKFKDLRDIDNDYYKPISMSSEKFMNDYKIVTTGD